MATALDNYSRMKAIHIIVKGDVQGVFFRKYTEKKAGELSLHGTVENLDDGTVEIYAEGEEAGLNQLVEWCHEGSPKANVEEVIVEDAQPKNFSAFKQKR